MYAHMRRHKMLIDVEQDFLAFQAAPPDTANHPEIPDSVLQNCANRREIPADSLEVLSNSHEVLVDRLGDQSNYEVPHNNL